MSKMADYVWTSTGGSSGYIGSPVRLYDYGLESAVFLEKSTGCTCTLSFESAQESTGPFVALASTTTNSSLAESFRMGITGPIGRWIQPRFTTASSTGFFRIRFLSID